MFRYQRKQVIFGPTPPRARKRPLAWGQNARVVHWKYGDDVAKIGRKNVTLSARARVVASQKVMCGLGMCRAGRSSGRAIAQGG